MCSGSTFLIVILINALKHFVTYTIVILGSKKSNLLPIIRVFNIKKTQFVVLNDLIMINIKKVLVPMHPKQQILDMKYHILDIYMPSNFLRDTIRTMDHLFCNHYSRKVEKSGSSNSDFFSGQPLFFNLKKARSMV